MGLPLRKLREMCAERHIAIHTKKKEELIAALMEVVPEAKDPGVQGGVSTGPSTGEVFELILRMQQKQMAWMQGQQRRQEQWMEAQQGCQRELMVRMSEQQERGRIAAEEARRAAKLPKPLLQKFTEKDDVESYLDMFERMGHSASGLALRRCSRQPLGACTGKCERLQLSEGSHSQAV